ncbi:hypothetical protein, partial [Halorubrum sp. SP3]
MRKRAFISVVLAVFLVTAAASGGVTVGVLSDSETVSSTLSVQNSSETNGTTVTSISNTPTSNTTTSNTSASNTTTSNTS